MSTKIPVAYNQSPVSTFLKILMKTCLIPVTVNPSERTVTFKLRSKSTLTFMLYNIILLGGSYGLLLYTDGITNLVMWFQAKMQELNPVDFISLMCISLSTLLIPNYTLFFSKQITLIGSEIILSQNLQLPNHWKKFVMATVLYTFSTLIITLIIQRISSVYLSGWFSVITMFLLISVSLSQFLIFFLILSFLDEFKRIIFLRSNGIISHTSKCISLLESLQKGLGTTFLLFFSFLQIQNIFCFYMSISHLMSMTINEKAWHIVMSVCYFVWSGYCMTILYCITLTADDAYDALQSLNSPLEKILINETDLTKKEYIKATMRKLEKTRPLNGNGYFNITRETLTSILSTTVTYLIILLQFR